MGTSNDNAEEATCGPMKRKRTSAASASSLEVPSTGNLLVDIYLTLDRLFRESEVLIATHCEDEKIIRQNLERLKREGRELVAADHPLIRDDNACFESTLTAIQFAQKHNSRLHVFHLSTEKEMPLFSNMLPLAEKPHHRGGLCPSPAFFRATTMRSRWGTGSNATPAIKAPA